MNRSQFSFISYLELPGLKSSHIECQITISIDATHPPFNQIIQGSVLWSSVRVPFCFSIAQKNSVQLGCWSLLTGIFPAKLRERGNWTPGNGSLTSKSIPKHGQENIVNKRTRIHSCQLVPKSPLGSPRIYMSTKCLDLPFTFLDRPG